MVSRVSYEPRWTLSCDVMWCNALLRRMWCKGWQCTAVVYTATICCFDAGCRSFVRWWSFVTWRKWVCVCVHQCYSFWQALEYIKKKKDLLSMQMAFCCSQWAYFSRTNGVNYLICQVLKDRAAVIVYIFVFVNKITHKSHKKSKTNIALVWALTWIFNNKTQSVIKQLRHCSSKVYEGLSTQYLNCSFHCLCLQWE